MTRTARRPVYVTNNQARYLLDLLENDLEYTDLDWGEERTAIDLLERIAESFDMETLFGLQRLWAEALAVDCDECEQPAGARCYNIPRNPEEERHPTRYPHKTRIQAARSL